MTRRKTLQFGISATFFSIAVVWLEIALFLAATSQLKAHWAALLLLFVNLFAICLVNGAFSILRKDKKTNDEEVKLDSATSELFAIKDDLVDESSNLIREKIILPYERRKIPLGASTAFVAAFIVTCALLPKRQSRL